MSSRKHPVTEDMSTEGWWILVN